VGPSDASLSGVLADVERRHGPAREAIVKGVTVTVGEPSSPG
jgi:hypothetical protein